MPKSSRIYVVKIPDQLVAGIRFTGPSAELTDRLTELLAAVKSAQAGAPIGLYHVRQGDQFDQEICVPVSRVVNEGDVISWTLPGRHLLCLKHYGSLNEDTEESALNASWEQLSGYIKDYSVALEHGPARVVYLEHGELEVQWVTELQVPILLPAWKERFAQGLDRFASEAARQEITQGSENITIETPPSAQATWVRGAMQRLELRVLAETARQKILTGCAHRYPQEQIDQLRAAYQELGSMERLLEFMQEEVAAGRAYYAVPEWDGSALEVTKVTWNAKGAEEAKSEPQRRANICHCGLVQAAIRSEQDVSPTFCYCGAGWFVQWWEGVLERPVQVTMLESILNGDDRCRFRVEWLDPSVV